MNNKAFRATKDQLQARLDLRKSNAAVPHRNRKAEAKYPGKGNRSAWKKEQRQQ